MKSARYALASSLVAATLLAGCVSLDPPRQKPGVAPDSMCLTETGSRIAPRDDSGCLPQAGTAYTREDLDRAAAPSLGEALRDIVPGSVRQGAGTPTAR